MGWRGTESPARGRTDGAVRPRWRRPAGILASLLLACAAGEATELRPNGTMQRHALMQGTRYETAYYVKAGAGPGPTVMVIGGVHGDEPAGYLAARKLLTWKVMRGTLIVLPEAHREAIRRGVRAYPENMNALFPGRRDGRPMQRLAFEIFEVVRREHPDLLLTLHESRDFHANDATRYGQTFCFDFPELVPMMRRVLARVNPAIAPAKHQFVTFVKPFPTCPTYQAWRALGVPATSIETARPLPLELRVRYQLLAIEAFLDETGLGYEPVGVARLPAGR